MRKSGHDRGRDVAGTGELKAVAEEAIRLGARALDKGRAWLIDRRDEMKQQEGRDGRDSEQARRQASGNDTGYYRADRGDEREGGRNSWMHDKHRQAMNTGHSDDAYDADRGREYGHASGNDQGGGYARSYDVRGYGRGWQDDGGQGRSHHGHGERDLYGEQVQDAEPRGYRGETYYDSGWRASAFDERAQSVGWEDDRGDAPGNSPVGYRGAGRFGTQNAGARLGDPRHGYYVYGSERAGSGGRDLTRDCGGPGRESSDRLRSSSRGRGEGYGRSSGYADTSGFGGSAYGSGFEPNQDEHPGIQRGAQSSYRSPNSDQPYRESGYQQQGYREQGMPSYRGHGPRQYTRSDERIIEDLNERLTDDDLIDASDIEVRCSDGKIVLEGEVSERWMKHRAEDIADACSGVKGVENRIRVRSGRDRTTLAADAESSGRSQSERAAASGRSSTAGAGTAAGSSATAGTGGSMGTSAGTSGIGTSSGTSSGNGGTSGGGASQSH